MRLIDAEKLKDFFFSETSGTEDIIRDLMMQHNLDYANDVNEDEVLDFAKELLKNVCNVIDTEPTAYNIDKVVEELVEELEEERTEILNSSDYENEIINYCLNNFDRAIEIVKQELNKS